MDSWRNIIGWAWLFRKYKFSKGTQYLEPRLDENGDVYMLITQPPYDGKAKP